MIVRLRARPVLWGAVLMFVALSAVYAFSIDMRATRGASITADEPFYLMTTVSLIDDGNLDMTAQYERESWRAFFDHPDGLWRQSVPTGDGLLLSPHEPGLSVLVIPGYLVDGLRGVQVHLMLLAALTFSLAYVFVVQESGLPLMSWLVTAAVGISATAFVYSTEIYPEVPAALCLVFMLLIIQQSSGGRHASPPGAWSGVLMAGLVTLLLWFGMKYAPLGVVLGLGFLWQADMRGRVALVALSAISGIAYVLFHYAVFEDLTSYSVNTVYEGADAANVLQSHVSIGDRAYRLWGLFVDQRFGIGRWAPVLLLLPASLTLLLRGSLVRRLTLALIVGQVLIATFVAITMMGWWFPGRTLMAVLPLFTLPITLLVARLPGWARMGAVGLAGVTAAFTVGLRLETATSAPVSPGTITLAVDPFDMGFRLFRESARLFPNYQAWTDTTVLLTIAWLGVLLCSMWFVAWREYGADLREIGSRARAMTSRSGVLRARDT